MTIRRYREVHPNGLSIDDINQQIPDTATSVDLQNSRHFEADIPSTSNEDLDEYMESLGFDLESEGFRDTYQFDDGSTQTTAAKRENISSRITTAIQTWLIDTPSGNLEAFYIDESQTRVYVTNDGENRIDQYSIDFGDISTLTFVNSFDVSAETTAPEIFRLDPTGTKGYLTTGSIIYQYTLSTAWDITTMTYDSINETPNWGGGNGTARDWHWNPNGRFIYAFMSVNRISTVELPSPWDITGATEIQLTDMTGLTEFPDGFAVTSDGWKVFVLQDGSSSPIYEFDMTYPYGFDNADNFQFVGKFDVGTANPRTIQISNDGTRFWFGDLNLGIYQNELGVKSSALIEGELKGTAIFPDGSTQGQGALRDGFTRHIDTIVEANLFTSASGDYQGVWVTNDKSRMLITNGADDTIDLYDMSEGDTSTAVFNASLDVSLQTTSAESAQFDPTGHVLYVASTAEIYQYTMETAYDIANAVFEDSDPVYAGTRDFYFRVDGRVLYVHTSTSNSTVRYYQLPTPWSVIGGRALGNQNFGSFGSGGHGIEWTDDGYKLYLTFDSQNKLTEFHAKEPWNMSNMDQGHEFFFPFGSIRDVSITKDGVKLYQADNTNGIYEYDIGMQTDGRIFSRGYETALTAPNEYNIFSEADLLTIPEITFSGGFYNVNSDVVLVIKELMTLSAGFNQIDDAELVINSVVNKGFIYLGTVPLYSGQGTLLLRRMSNVSIGTGDWVNKSNSNFFVEGVFVSGFDSLGTLELCNVGLTSIQFNDIDNELNFLNCERVLSSGIIFAPPFATTNFFRYENYVHEKPFFSLSQATGNLESSRIARVEPCMRDQSRVSIDNSSVFSAAMFDTTGATGTFTAVADASVATTAITSVTDNGGAAQFNFTVGPTVYVGQELNLSGFATHPEYNGTYIVTATGIGTFETILAFLGDDTGSFDGNSITLTDTGTTLSEGDSVNIETDDSTDYDGGSRVYNVLANSFQINRAFTVTATGSWSKAGLNQKDPKVLSSNNAGYVDSKYIATAYVNNNATANGTITNNVFRSMAFGTTGSALIQGSTIERWKLIDDVEGVFEYVGNEPLDGFITFDFTVVSAGGSVDFRFKWEIDTGGGFVGLPDAVEALVNVGADAQSVTKTFPLVASKGDQIRPRITRNSGASTITTTYATIYSTQ